MINFFAVSRIKDHAAATLGCSYNSSSHLYYSDSNIYKKPVDIHIYRLFCLELLAGFEPATVGCI